MKFVICDCGRKIMKPEGKFLMFGCLVCGNTWKQDDEGNTVFVDKNKSKEGEAQ